MEVVAVKGDLRFVKEIRKGKFKTNITCGKCGGVCTGCLCK